MDEAAIYATLTAIFRDVFLRDDIVATPDLNAAGVPGWDSMKQIELLIAIEEQYAVKFTTREVDHFGTVGDVVDALRSRHG